MSQPATKQRPSAARTRHEDDLYTWVQEQVELLRAGRFADVDAENVAEDDVLLRPFDYDPQDTPASGE